MRGQSSKGIQSAEGGRVLLLTVGVGNIDDLEKSLIVPMLKSIEKGDWRRVVLLPSKISEASASLLQDRVRGSAVEIRPLPEANQENDADACFGHFDRVIGELFEQDIQPNGIVTDFTRGTKAMSAALVLAAVRRGIPRLRYVHSSQRDKRGTVVPGTEKVGEIFTSLVTARRRLDLGAELMRRGDFGAVLSLLPDPESPFFAFWPKPLLGETAYLIRVSKVCAAWDRLDYGSAAFELNTISDAVHSASGEFAPDGKVRDWLSKLASEPDRSKKRCYAAWLRCVAIDLLANAERRVRDRQYEDALLRVYRILELVGQFRLFDKGYDSGNIPGNDPQVEKLRVKLKNNRRQDFGIAPRKGHLTAPRELAARFLKFLGDPFGEKLLRFDNQDKSIKVASRNRSILVHGFTAQAPRDESSLRKHIENLERLLIDDDKAAKQRLDIARWPDFQRNH